MVMIITHFGSRSEIPGQVLPYPLAVIASVNLRSIFEVRNHPNHYLLQHQFFTISQVDEVAQSVTVDTTLRFKWKVMLFGLKMFSFLLYRNLSEQDDRITVNISALATGKDYVYIDGVAANRLWIPDIIIDKVRVV